MNEAEQLYVSETSEKSLARGYLRLSLVILGLVASSAVTGCVWMALASGKRHAYVVRIEPSGQTEVVVEGFQFKQQPAEVKMFLRNFCRDYFSRSRSTIEALPRTLLAFSPELRSDIDSAWKSAKTVENAVSNPTQVEASVTDKDIHLARDGTEAYITVRLDRSVNGQKYEPQTYSTYIRFDCLACSGKAVDPEVAQFDPLGFQINNIPALEGSK